MRLEVENLSCARAGRTVFTGLSFALGPGDGLLVRGGNGTGKSSLLRLIAGLDEAASGRILYRDHQADQSPGELCHYLSHADAVKPALTLAEHLHFFAAVLGAQALHAKDIAAALSSVDLADLSDLPARYLSAGQKRRLALSRLVLTKRPLWLLDEPTTVLDTASVSRFEALLADHLRQGGMAIATTHESLAIPNARTLHLGAQ